MSNYQGAWTYKDLHAWIDKGRSGWRRTVANNTEAYHGPGGDDKIIVALHGNPIATFWKDGRTAFTLAGWNSNTTRQRLNMMMPRGSGVRTVKGDPYLITQAGDVRITDSRMAFEVNEHGRLMAMGR